VIIAQGDCFEYWQHNACGAVVRPFRMTSAWDARNAGILASSGDHTLIFDDDAEFVDEDAVELMMGVLSAGSVDDVHIFDRGYTSAEGNFISYNAAAPAAEIKRSSVLSKTTAWNVVFPRRLLLAVGLTPPIGVGSKHACQSGEDYLLVRKVLASKWRGTCRYHPDIRITHPCFYGKTKKELWLCLGYQYGAGYVRVTDRFIGLGRRPLGDMLNAVVAFLGIIKMVIGLSPGLRPAERGRGATFTHRVLPAIVRFAGVLDGLSGRLPRKLIYLRHVVAGNCG